MQKHKTDPSNKAPSPTRNKSDIEADYIATSRTLTALSQLLLEASINHGDISNETLTSIAMFMESQIENIDTFFYQMSEV